MSNHLVDSLVTLFCYLHHFNFLGGFYNINIPKGFLAQHKRWMQFVKPMHANRDGFFPRALSHLTFTFIHKTTHLVKEYYLQRLYTLTHQIQRSSFTPAEINSASQVAQKMAAKKLGKKLRPQTQWLFNKTIWLLQQPGPVIPRLANIIANMQFQNSNQNQNQTNQNFQKPRKTGKQKQSSSGPNFISTNNFNLLHNLDTEFPSLQETNRNNTGRRVSEPNKPSSKQRRPKAREGSNNTGSKVSELNLPKHKVTTSRSMISESNLQNTKGKPTGSMISESNLPKNKAGQTGSKVSELNLPKHKVTTSRSMISESNLQKTKGKPTGSKISESNLPKNKAGQTGSVVSEPNLSNNVQKTVSHATGSVVSELNLPIQTGKRISESDLPRTNASNQSNGRQISESYLPKNQSGNQPSTSRHFQNVSNQPKPKRPDLPGSKGYLLNFKNPTINSSLVYLYKIPKSRLFDNQSQTIEVRGSQSPLSNFHPSKFNYNGSTVYSAEQAYQLAKAMSVNAWEEAKKMQYSKQGPDAKQVGNSVNSNYPTHEWDKKKLQVLEGILIQKIDQDQHFKEQLLSTYPCKLTHPVMDKFWGSKYWISKGKIGIGQDQFGLLLMRLRFHYGLDSGLTSMAQLEDAVRKQSTHPTISQSKYIQISKQQKQAQIEQNRAKNYQSIVTVNQNQPVNNSIQNQHVIDNLHNNQSITNQNLGNTSTSPSQNSSHISSNQSHTTNVIEHSILDTTPTNSMNCLTANVIDNLHNNQPITNQNLDDTSNSPIQNSSNQSPSTSVIENPILDTTPTNTINCSTPSKPNKTGFSRLGPMPSIIQTQSGTESSPTKLDGTTFEFDHHEFPSLSPISNHSSPGTTQTAWSQQDPTNRGQNQVFLTQPNFNTARPILGPHKKRYSSNAKSKWQLTKTSEQLIIIGDSNLDRIEKSPDNLKSFSIHSFPGARLCHFKNMFTVANFQTPTSQPTHVILSMGINNRDKPLQEASLKEQLTKTFRGIKTKYPNAQILFPLINCSTQLPKSNVETITLFNQMATKLAGTYKIQIIPKLKKALFQTQADNIHWTSETGYQMLEHWCNYLN